MNELLELANEGGTYEIEVDIQNESHVTADDGDVSSVTVSVQNNDGDFIVQNRSVSEVGTQTVILSGGTDLQIEDQAKDKELRYFTVEATVESKPIKLEKKFYVKNLHKVTT